MKGICESVVRHVNTAIWTDEAKLGLVGDLGEDGLRFVQEACEFAYNQKDLWRDCPFEKAWKEVIARVREKYPELDDEEAAKRIVSIAAYSWLK